MKIAKIHEKDDIKACHKSAKEIKWFVSHQSRVFVGWFVDKQQYFGHLIQQKCTYNEEVFYRWTFVAV
jgi:hypothetical protein